MLNDKIKKITIDQDQIKEAADNIWDAANSIICREYIREIENLVKPLLDHPTKVEFFKIEAQAKELIKQQNQEHAKLKEQLKAQEDKYYSISH
ncbi:hypothetical protein [Rickettsia endosymbiont of Gonocerus acuteangulatus]|uniref:hypothetical protein n=1 Tax=Rickettsia endosymbiont of Gonocerus acuteangulatus TaxID=3066266 RepID=UPI003132DD52